MKWKCKAESYYPHRQFCSVIFRAVTIHNLNRLNFGINENFSTEEHCLFVFYKFILINYLYCRNERPALLDIVPIWSP